ncbi:Ectopic P granules protein 5 like protein, partial [Dufourea novaeangliae]
QKRGKEIKRLSIDQNIPDVPTLEGFECLLGESPTNYPKGEGIENMESELHFAAIDAEIYDLETNENDTQETELQLENIAHDTQVPNNNTVAPDLSMSTAASDLSKSTAASELSKSTAASDLSKSTLNTSNVKNFECSKKIKEKTESSTDTVDGTNNTLKEVKPFTDSQLALLYDNQELGIIDMFISEFTETQLRSSAVKQQHRLQVETQKQLWCLDKASITEAGECQDGNPVTATHEYSIAHFNKKALISLSRTLSTIKDMLHNTQALYSYEAELLRLQIEHYIQSVCNSCKEFASLSQNAPISLAIVQTHLQIIPQLVEIRMCITILFNFQRKLLKDGKFVTDTREWLTKLVAILLRVANWQDHLFLLNHILRCPGGVMNWACSYVQMPAPQEFTESSTSPLNDPYLDHIVATLAVILLPIKDRDKFLEQVQISLQDTTYSPGDTVWVMLDQEGEEDEDIANSGANLYENDLISLLNQIPFNKVFKHILYIQCQNDGYHQNKNFITHHHMLRLFAFFTIIVKLLRQGLKTYDSPRYRQLAKRLCALIRDIVQYTSDQWEEFNKTQ